MVDVKHYGDAVGASAIAARTPWSGSAAHLGCTLGGAAGEGGLLATFDAIFQQTMTPQPTAPAASDIAPSKSETPPAADDAEPARANKDEDEDDDDEREDDEAPRDVRHATPLAEPPVVESPEPLVLEEQAVTEEPQMEAAAPTASATATPKIETPAEQSASAAEVQSAEEQGVTPVIKDRHQLPGEHLERPMSPVPQTIDAGQPTPAVAQAVDPAVPVEQPAAIEPEAPPVAESADAADEAPRIATELHRSTVAIQEQQPTRDEPIAVDEATPEEQIAEPAPEGDGESNRDRDRDGGARYSNHDEQSERHVRGAQGARAPEASAGNRALDSLVAQMQPIDAGDAGAALPPGATPGAAAATASAAALAANPSLAANASAANSAVNPTVTDTSAPSDTRVSIDGAGERRSIGGIKSEAAGGGEGQVQRGSNADQVRLIQRVARSFQRLGPTGGRVQVMLHPAELGSVRLDLRIEGNRLNARMTAETDAARSILSEHLPELRQRLADSGLVVDRIEVEIDGRGQEETGQGREGMDERHGGFHSAPQRPRFARSGTSPSESAGGQGAIPQPAAPAYSRSALDLMA